MKPQNEHHKATTFSIYYFVVRTNYKYSSRSCSTHFPRQPSLHSTGRNATELPSKTAKYHSSMALGTSAIIRETTTVVKQVLKTVLHRKGAPPASSPEEEDGLNQALLDDKVEHCCEQSPDMDSHTIVRTRSWV